MAACRKIAKRQQYRQLKKTGAWRVPLASGI
jgi:hypothetical protein